MEHEEMRVYEIRNNSILTNEQLQQCIAAVIQQRALRYGNTMILQTILGDVLTDLIIGDTKRRRQLEALLCSSPFVVVDFDAPSQPTQD